MRRWPPAPPFRASVSIFIFLLHLLAGATPTEGKRPTLSVLGGQTRGQYLARERQLRDAPPPPPPPPVSKAHVLSGSTATTPGIDPCSDEAVAETAAMQREEVRVRMVIVVGMACLLGMYLCGYILDYYHILFFPEAGCGIIIGIIVSFIVYRFMNSSVEALIQFNPEFFFVNLLPPIMFEAGYNMKRQPFFRNIGGICVYAFVGTTISCFAVGGIVYGFGQAGLCHPVGGLASLVFGALISATDPVSVLAVFQKLKANVDLYSLVFGESALNDAVAIVLYRTLIGFKCSITPTQIAMAFVQFVVIFAGSTFVGISVAVFSALITKHCRMRDNEEFFFYEVTVLCCFPYMAFMLGEALQLSGIVAILFCGIAMSHYTYDNLSHDAQDTSRKFFKIIASLAESFVFIYLGLAMFTFPQTWKLMLFLLVSCFACLVARFLNVYPLSLVINCVRPADKRITQKMQFIAWFSGLRGAVAFLIAVESWGRQDFPQVTDPNNPDYTDSDAILSTTLFISVITVFCMGGPIGYFLTWFDLREKETEEEHAAYGSTPGLMGRGLSAPMPAVGSIYVDRKYIKPFLTVGVWDENNGTCRQPDQNSAPEEMTSHLVTNEDVTEEEDATA